MAKAPWQALVGYLRRLSADAAAPASDGALLERFVTAGDEAAFTELVQPPRPACLGCLPAAVAL